MKKEIIFSITGAKALDGGIANANHNIIQALIVLSKKKSFKLRILSYLETDKDRPDYLPELVKFEGFEGNKTKFIFTLFKYGIKNKGFFLFDHVSLANAVLPFAVTGVTTNAGIIVMRSVFLCRRQAR